MSKAFFWMSVLGLAVAPTLGAADEPQRADSAPAQEAVASAPAEGAPKADGAAVMPPSAATKAAALDLQALTPREADGWEQKAEAKGVRVYGRARPGNPIQELRSVGEIDAPPHAVMRVLADFERYAEIMPYTEESRIVGRAGERGVFFYTVVNPPMVSRRDYVLRVEDASDWKDGKGYLRSQWTCAAGDIGPAPQEGRVRLTLNDGSWTLQPIDDGRRTLATYDLFTDPGGSLPVWIINKANRSTIPDIFEVLRKSSKEPRYREAGQARP